MMSIGKHYIQKADSIVFFAVPCAQRTGEMHTAKGSNNDIQEAAPARELLLFYLINTYDVCVIEIKNYTMQDQKYIYFTYNFTMNPITPSSAFTAFMLPL